MLSISKSSYSFDFFASSLDSISVLWLPHDLHQLLNVVSAPRVDRVAVGDADLLSHLGGEVELDGGLGNVEVSAAEKAEDQSLVFSQSCGVAGAQTVEKIVY
jgi:hypothetical protein